MPKLSVCLEMFWGEAKLEDKIGRARKLGFDAVEFWSWKNKDIATVEAALRSAHSRVTTFCMVADRALVDPFAAPALQEGLRQSADTARRLGVRQLILTTGNERKGESFEVTRRSVVRNLKTLLPLLEQHDLTLCLEPLNVIRDHLGYWLSAMSDAADIVLEVGHPKVKILMDIYHQQITEGNIIAAIRQYIGLIGHFHCAGVPGRHELAGGELDYRAIFKAIDDAGYDGYVGLEFTPETGEEKALREARSLASL